MTTLQAAMRGGLGEGAAKVCLAALYWMWPQHVGLCPMWHCTGWLRSSWKGQGDMMVIVPKDSETCMVSLSVTFLLVNKDLQKAV